MISTFEGMRHRAVEGAGSSQRHRHHRRVGRKAAFGGGLERDGRHQHHQRGARHHARRQRGHHEKAGEHEQRTRAPGSPPSACRPASVAAPVWSSARCQRQHPADEDHRPPLDRVVGFVQAKATAENHQRRARQERPGTPASNRWPPGRESHEHREQGQRCLGLDWRFLHGLGEHDEVRLARQQFEFFRAARRAAARRQTAASRRAAWW